MATYPEIQNKAREQLDAMVGSGRLPAYEDQERLPYIHAIFLECMRWMPVVPLGVSRSLSSDDYYNGYLIPKGTIIIPVSDHYTSKSTMEKLTLNSVQECLVCDYRLRKHLL